MEVRICRDDFSNGSHQAVWTSHLSSLSYGYRVIGAARRMKNYKPFKKSWESLLSPAMDVTDLPPGVDRSARLPAARRGWWKVNNAGLYWNRRLARRVVDWLTSSDHIRCDCWPSKSSQMVEKRSGDLCHQYGVYGRNSALSGTISAGIKKPLSTILPQSWVDLAGEKRFIIPWHWSMWRDGILFYSLYKETKERVGALYRDTCTIGLKTLRIL